MIPAGVWTDFEKRRRGTFNTSGPERRVSEAFEKAFGKENVAKQYRDARYPFACDIYFGTEDLFVECNFHWTHGTRPSPGLMRASAGGK